MDISKILAEIFYCVIGIIFIFTGVKAIKDEGLKERWRTALFWFILAFTFMVGPYLPYWITGICVLAIPVLTATGSVKQSKSDIPAEKVTRKHADKLGYKIFIPALCLAIPAVLVATLLPSLGANNAIGISAVVGAAAVLLVTKSPAKGLVTDGTRLMDNVGTTGILPQLLAALGALFTAAGVGDVIAKGVSAIVPDGSHFIAVIIYCLGMAIFTIIMGNGFAAFSVITVGIGIPFLIAQGANPVVIGALGLTAGYCGTLITPMAANFNIMPAALLETKSKYTIIKAQVPVALTMMVVHILLMYFLAF